MSALSFRDVRVRRGPREVLRVSELDVEEGETLAVLGPNGAGKSTLLLTAALLLDLANGEIQLFGEPAEGGRGRVRQRRMTATVFQEPALLDMSVRRNLETALALHGVPRREHGARTERWLARLGVAHLAGAQPHMLSGGEAQRVALARAFAVEPRMLFLDEPFSSLDSATRAELVGELRTLLASERTTALIVTHDVSEVQLLAGRVAVIFDGELAQHGAVEDILTRPSSASVGSFLGYAVVAREQLAGSALDALAVADGATTIGIRPTAIDLVRDQSEGGSTVYLDAEVAAVQGGHGRGRLMLSVGEATLAADLPVDAIRQLEVGTLVRIRVDPSGVVAW